jgi:hypothetical protein
VRLGLVFPTRSDPSLLSAVHACLKLGWGVFVLMDR